MMHQLLQYQIDDKSMSDVLHVLVAVPSDEKLQLVPEGG